MFATPFCSHTFTEEQLASLEWVVCPCGYHYRSDLLRDYSIKNQNFLTAKNEVEQLVQLIAQNSNEHRPASTAQVAPQSTYSSPAPARPKRERASVSVSQWLIISASILVLIAASVFVQGNLERFNAIGWMSLEGTLAVLAVAGTVFSRKMSVLLSNFLAVFAASMLMTFIMTLGTQLGLGFNDFRDEPSWFWAVNLALISIATSVGAKLTKNFGWRALSPITLAISGLMLTYGAVGDAIKETPGAFGWQLITLSATAIALLSQLKLLRGIKLVVDPKSRDKAYEEDLFKREDAALQQFAFYTTLLLAIVGAGVTLYQVLTSIFTPFDAIATLALGAFWLVGSATIDYWGSSLSRTGEVSKLVKAATWSIAYVSIGLGANALGHALTANSSLWWSLLLSLAITLVLSTLPHFARFVKPPKVTMTATSWAVFGTWIVWTTGSINGFATILTSLGIQIYLIAFGLVLMVSAWVTKTKTNAVAIGITNTLGVVMLGSWILENLAMPKLGDLELPQMQFPLATGILILAIVTLGSLPAIAEPVLAKRSDVTPRGWVNWLSYVGVALATLNFTAVSLTVGVDQVGMSVSTGTLSIGLALAAWAVTAQLLARAKNSAHLSAHSITPFVLVLFVALSPTGRADEWSVYLLGAFALIAYAFGYLDKRGYKLQVGLATAMATVYLAVERNAVATDTLDVDTMRFAILFGAVPALVAVHSWLVAKRSTTSAKANASVAMGVVLFNAAVAPLFGLSLYQNGLDWIWSYLALGMVALVASELVRNKHFVWTGRVIAVGAAGIGFLNAMSFMSAEELETSRLIGTVLSTFGVAVAIRAMLAAKNPLWAIGTYLGSVGITLAFGSWITLQMQNTWDGPEIHSLLFAGLLVINGYFLTKATSKAKLLLTVDVPLVVALLPSLLYAVVKFENEEDNVLRYILIGAIVGGYGYWRANRSKNATWTIAGFAGAALMAGALVREVYLNTSLDFKGPELYSVAILVTVFLGIRFLAKIKPLTGTLITWGAPLAVMILPSAVYSYEAVTSRFEDLDAMQITRVLAVLLVSVVALVIGMRAGNLGSTAAGTAGLTLTAIPNLWFRVDGVAQGNTTAELRALVIGGILFLILAVGKRFKFIRANSVVFIGIPTAVALAPAVANTLFALGHPTFSDIDWWRFGIVLAVSLTLLVVGSMRELGGMFYPGFAGVMVAALPYGFREVKGASWLLWLILLLIAATLIWLAMRLERMRKAGRTPAMWLKELK